MNDIQTALQNFITSAHDPTQQGAQQRKKNGEHLLLLGGAISVNGLAQLAFLPTNSLATVLLPLSVLATGYDVSRVGWNLINLRVDKALLQGGVGVISALVSGKGPNVAIAGCGAIFDKTLFLGLLAKWILEQNQS